MDEHHAQMKGLAWILFTLFMALFFGVGLPRLARWLPWSVEKALARTLGGFSDLGACKGSKESEESLTKSVGRIYPLLPGDEALPVQVEIIRGDTVNAFATLGGKIYVFDGLLKKSESAEEFVGVLAHEIEHVKERHIIQSVFTRIITIGLLHFIFSGGGYGPETLHWFLNLKFSRSEENEADTGGLERLEVAHVDPRGIHDFFLRLEKSGGIPAILSDHPSSADRALLAEKYTGLHSTPVLTTFEWKNLQRICSPAK